MPVESLYWMSVLIKTTKWFPVCSYLLTYNNNLFIEKSDQCGWLKSAQVPSHSLSIRFCMKCMCVCVLESLIHPVTDRNCSRVVKFLTCCLPFLTFSILSYCFAFSFSQFFHFSSFPLYLNHPLFFLRLPLLTFTEPALSMVLRTFYSIQNINLSSRTIITLSSRAAALFYWKQGLFAFHLSVFNSVQSRLFI